MLYLVATPIGNLADMTFRAVDVLKKVDMIAAEDTRHSAKLLAHYEISTPYFSLHDHNEEARIEKIVQLLRDQKSVALISDAGTPLISDPGFKMVRAVREAGFAVTAIPGACAAIAGLIVSGLPTDQFIFEGFLPAKAGELKKYLEVVMRETRTIIFYESAHRIQKTLVMMRDVLGGDRVAAVARELTKTFETIQQGSLTQLCEWVATPHQDKGEFVVILAGAPEVEEAVSVIHGVLKILLSELPVKQSAQLAAKITGCSKNRAYEMALLLKPMD